MTTITTRAGKGSALTNNELDANFINLNAEVSPSRPTIRPSLSLDFANSKSVDSRITFTRASSATRYDANGVLQKVVNDQPRIDFDPSTGECKGLLVEEQRTNAQTYSSNPSQSWTQSASYAQYNNAIAPDGTLTATKLVEDKSLGEHFFLTAPSANLTGNVTASIYVKAAERTAIQFRTWSGSYVIYNIDLTTGVTTHSGIYNATSPSCTATQVGNGWWRIVMSASNTSYVSRLWIALITSNTTYYTGDGVSGVYIWGAQLEQGAFATSYIPSTDTFTSRASSASYFDSTGTLRYAGVNQPRYGYGYDTTSGTWKSQGLVLEAAATNLCPDSVYIANSVGYANGTITHNASTAPDGSITAALLSQTSAATFYTASGSAFGSLVSGTAYTISYYVKAGTTDKFYILFYGTYFNSGGTNPVAAFDLTTKTATITAGPITSLGMQSIGNGWYRVFASCVSTYTGIGNSQLFRMQDPGAAANMYIWGMQVETGYVPTSYIPTYGASATRAADVSSSAQTTRASDKAVVIGNTLTNALNPIEGCLVWSRSRSAVGALPELTLFADGGSGTDFYYKALAWMNTAQSCNVTSLNNSVSQFSQTVTIPTDLSVVTTAFAYAENNMAASINGSSPTTDTVASVQQSVNTLGLAIPGSNNSNQHIRKVVYYPKRLTNAQLQALTA